VDVVIGLVTVFILWNGLKKCLNQRGLDTPLFFDYNTFVEVDKNG
jgi:spore maturation protein SpmA